MSGDVKKRKSQELSDTSQNEKDSEKPYYKRPKLKPNSGLKRTGSGLKKKKQVDRPDERKGNPLKGKSLLQRAKAVLYKNSFKKQASSRSQKDISMSGKKGSKDGGKHGNGDMGLQKVKKRINRRRRKDNAVLDEASRLQRRTRYLLIKVKLEQNLIDAYSTEGWKGQSREKIKPDKELERAKKQILNCKLGIREAIRQLDLLSSPGRIEDSAVAPDGSVHHEHIICAACKLREAFPDNDIILCDGTCNRAFHQKCLDPPLSTENIPPGDEGWFCRYCKSKMEILEATNAHLGTNFAVDSNWQDIFNEEANLNDSKELCQDQEWPSDDSQDVDYNPESKEYSCTNSVSSDDSDSSVYGSSSCSLRSLQDDILFLSKKLDNSITGSEDKSSEIDSDGTTDCEILSGPRTRKAVDYIKLHDELFGKNAPFSEHISEDEDWGPSRRKHRGKEPIGEGTNTAADEKQGNFTEEKSTEVKRKQSANKSIIITSSENECNSAEERSAEAKKTGKSKRPIFRFPRNVVEKLRVVFAENELPSKTIRENLSKQLGLDAEKVNKWFKNSRYLALKARKKGITHHASSPMKSDESVEDGVEKNPDDAMASQDMAVLHEHGKSRDMKTSGQRSTARLVASNFNRKRSQLGLPSSPVIKKVPVDFGDDVSLKLLREKVKKKKKLNLKRTIAQNVAKEAEDELERLCKIKDRIEKLQEILLRLPNRRYNKVDAAAFNEFAVSYVPIAELREKW